MQAASTVRAQCASAGTDSEVKASNSVDTNPHALNKEPTMRKIVFALALAIPMSWSLASFAQGTAAPADPKKEEKAPAKKTAKADKKDTKAAKVEKKDEKAAAAPAKTEEKKDEKAAAAPAKTEEKKDEKAAPAKTAPKGRTAPRTTATK